MRTCAVLIRTTSVPFITLCLQLTKKGDELFKQTSLIYVCVPSLGSIRENAETALALYRGFVLIALQSLIGLTAITISNAFRLVDPIPILEKIFGAIFNLTAALPLTTAPLILYLCSDKVNAAVKRQYRKVFYSKAEAKRASQRELVGLDGNQLQIKTNEEANVYFEQLRVAWK
ncbi:hypothetical protein RB195_020434 [Necator americanus]|uniref:Uncharacterized protein n=1 Tax=Necator americanus TaxID=51031 RepID=A0ABR1CIU1_NECAM